MLPACIQMLGIDDGGRHLVAVVGPGVVELGPVELGKVHLHQQAIDIQRVVVARKAAVFHQVAKVRRLRCEPVLIVRMLDEHEDRIDRVVADL